MSSLSSPDTSAGIKPFEDIPDIRPDTIPPRSLKPFDPMAPTAFIHSATESPIYRLVVAAADGPVDSLWLNDETEAKRILLDEEGVWRKGPQTYEPFASLVPLHLITLEGDYHAKMRIKAQSALGNALASDRIPGELIGQKLIQHIREAISNPAKPTWMGIQATLEDGGPPVLVTSVIDRIFRACALEIVTTAIFGKSWETIQDYSPTNIKANALAELMQELHWRVADFNQREWRKNARALPAGPLLDVLDAFILDEVAISRAKPETVVSDRMLDEWARDGDLSTEEVRNLAMTFLTMGSENVSTGLAWTLVQLSESESDQEQARGSLEALSRCFDETVRLFPSVPVLTRVCTRDTVVCGYHIPRYSEVVINMYAIHRGEQTWGDRAGDFLPSRCPVISTQGPPDAFPFGGGRRACVGRPLTNFELKTVLFPVLKAFKVAPVKFKTNRGTAVFELNPKARTRPNNFVSFRPGTHSIAFIPLKAPVTNPPPAKL